MSANVCVHRPLIPVAADDVTVTMSGDSVYIRVPPVDSWHRELTVIWRLHQIWSTSLFRAATVTVDLTALDHLPGPLATVLWAFEQDLRRTGCAMEIMRRHASANRSPEAADMSESRRDSRPITARVQGPPTTAGQAGPVGKRRAGRLERREKETDHEPRTWH